MTNIYRIRMNLQKYALKTFGKEIEDCNTEEKYSVLSEALMDEILPLWVESKVSSKIKSKHTIFQQNILWVGP